MGFKITELYAELTAKDAGFKSAIGGAKTLSESATGALNGLANEAKGLLVHLGLVVSAGAAVKYIIESFAAKEVAINNLAAAFRLSGDESHYAVAKAREFASGIQAVTTTSEDAVLAALRFGSTVGHLRGDALEGATRAAVGLAAALGIDLDQAMKLVVKAKNGNTVALKKLGIELDDSLSKQEKYQKVLQIGNDGFDLARAKVDTLSGSFQQLKNEASDLANDLGETVGGALTALVHGLDYSVKGFRYLFALIASARGKGGNDVALEAFSKLPIDKMIRAQNDLAFNINSNPEGEGADQLRELWSEREKIMRGRIAAEKDETKAKEAAAAKQKEIDEKNANEVMDFDHEIAANLLDEEQRKIDAAEYGALKRMDAARKMHEEGKTTEKQFADQLVAIEAAKEKQLDDLAEERAKKKGKELADELAKEREYREKTRKDITKAGENVETARERLQNLRDESNRPQILGQTGIVNKIQEGITGERNKQIQLAQDQLDAALRREKLLQANNNLLEAMGKIPGGLILV